MSLNLTRGMEDFLYGLDDIEEDDLVWKEEPFKKNWTYLEEDLITLWDNISVAYSSVFQGCFLPNPIFVDVKEEPFSFYFGEQVYALEPHRDLDEEKVIRSLRNCLSNEQVKLICIMVFVLLGNDAHLCTLVINKVHKQVELHDPNGYSYGGMPKELPVSIARDFLFQTCGVVEIGVYKITSLISSNLPYGFQHYQNLYQNKYCDKGLCQTWAFYIAQLRAEYIEDTTKEFRSRCDKRLRELVAFFRNSYGPEAHAVILGKYLTAYILNYLLTVEADKPYTQKKGTVRKKASGKRKRSSRSRSRSSSPKVQRNN